MRAMRRLGGLLLLCGTLAGCALPAPPDAVQAPDNAMVFGHLVAPQEITKIEFREYGKFYLPPFKIPPRVLVFENGDFMVENIKPGKYYIAAVYSRFRDYTFVKDNRTAYQNMIHVQAGETKFAGSFVIHELTDTSRFRRNVVLRKVRKPAERDVLRNMYEFTRGTGWQARIDRRLKELRM